MNGLLKSLDFQEIHDVVAGGVRQILENTHMRLIQEAFAACAANPNSPDNKVRLRALLATLNQHNEEIKQKKTANKENISASKRNANIPSNDDTDNESKESARPRRKAAAAASQNIAEQVNVSIRDKLRQDAPIKIKTERISDQAIVEDVQDKVEMPPPAALPKRAGKKKKETMIKVEDTGSRATRTRTTNLTAPGSPTSLPGKRSDVVLIPAVIPTIALDADETDEAENAAEANEDTDELEEMPNIDSDADAPDAPPPKAQEVRQSTKVKVKKEAAKRKKSASPEERKPARPKRTKRKPSTPAKDTDTSLYEDAVNVPQSADVTDDEIIVQQPKVLLHRLSKEVMEEAAKPKSSITEADLKNRTIVIQKAAPNPNETVVLDKPQILNATVTLSKEAPPSMADLMTDDESDTEKPPPVPKQHGKALFNPCVNSPVKKKVEAFEKLQAGEAPARVTRTKTRQKAKAVEEETKDEKVPSAEAEPAAATASKLKKPGYTTPLATNRFQPSLSSKTQLSSSAQKALSAIKLSSQQFRDLEQVRKEKEEAAQKKRDAYYLQQAEEKRRRREEKEQKVKAQRAAQEEKRRVAEQQKEEKEEKLKAALLEKQERMMKQREESEKRRLLARQKHEELKREEERKRAEEVRLLRKAEEDERRKAEAEKRLQALKAKQMQRELEVAEKEVREMQKAALPTYINEPEPLLPTPDCYDSDDEDRPKNVDLPKWNSKESVHQRCKAMSYIDPKVLNTLFSVKPQTPNLQELFPNVDPRKLKRNSSAVWKHPPRFTMMPELQEEF